MKKWQCLVCGYIHTGEGPPEECPVCRADKSRFSEISDEASSSRDYKGLAQRLMIKHHIHPISTHIPNGVIPMAVIFIFLSAVFKSPGLADASLYSLVFVLLTLPMVIYSGFNEWRIKYRSNLNNLFVIKIITAFIVGATTLIVVIWHLIEPGIAVKASPRLFGFLFIHLVMLAAAVIAGLIGGRLVFKD